MRQVFLDTETTGTSADTGDRIVEIGCVEVIDRVITGNSFVRYINPEYPVSAVALLIHGLSNEFLASHPIFGDIAGELVQWLEGADEILMHNAGFDEGFMDAEFARLEGFNCGHWQQCTRTDTLQLAREHMPGLPSHKLDSLCRTLKIDLSERSEHHGALIDARLLAMMYLQMTGGQKEFLVRSTNYAKEFTDNQAQAEAEGGGSSNSDYVVQRATQEELDAHSEFMQKNLKQ